MKSMQFSRYSRQVRACTLAAFVLVGFTSIGAIAGNVHSGASDVNQVFGRSSAMPKQGAPSKTAGLIVDAIGRSSNPVGNSDMSTGIATRTTDGLLAEYGRGTPNLAITHKGASSGNLAANAR
jgi:hypothetical protein